MSPQRQEAVRRGAGLAVVLVLLVVAAVAFAGSDSSKRSEPLVEAPHGGPDTIYAGPNDRVALNGRWRFRRDPRAIGTGEDFPAGRFRGSLLRLPFVPNAKQISGDAGSENFAGSVAWYRTNVTVKESGRYAIGFESVNHKADVFVNGRRVATHKGEYLPFETRVDLEAGKKNRLVVRADWRCPICMKRDGWHRLWFNFGGINRGVTIRPIGDSEVRHPMLRTRLGPDGSALVRVTATIRNAQSATRDIPVKGTLENGDRKIDLEFGEAKTGPRGSEVVVAEAEIDDPDLWSPSSPTLSELKVEVPGESSYRARVGLREVKADGKRLLLNGKELKLRGASIHEDVFGRGDALLPADQDRIITQLKAMNANATRSQHPIHPALMERLDRAGIVVWQGVGPTDAPGAWTSVGAERVKVAKNRVRTTLRQAQLHPSIITWNLANEVAGGGHPDGQIPYIDSMASELKRTDPSRPVALDIWGKHAPRENSLIYRNIDMIGWTNYIGWYESTFGTPEQLRGEIRARLGRLRAIFPDKVIAVTEFGAEGNDENAPDAPGGYDFQTSLIDLHLGTYAQVPDLAGALIWNLRDFALTPSFAGGSIKRSVPDIKIVRGVNEKGLYDLQARPKPSLRAVTRRFAAQAAAGR